MTDLQDINPIKILHVEKSPVDAQIIANTLYDSNINIASIELVTTLKSAVPYLYTHNVDIILLDLNIEDSFGLSSFEALHSHFSDIPIIVLSSAECEELALEAIKLGAQDYLIKCDISKYTISKSITYALERKHHEHVLFTMANTDHLTGLPNRHALTQFLETYFLRCDFTNSAFSLVYINCDKFKVLNDTIGHLLADEFLKHFAAELKNMLSPKDYLARVAGDEFVIALNVDEKNIQPVDMFYKSILTLFNSGLRLKSKEVVKASCSIGVAKMNFIDRSDPVESLTRHAVSAMYKVKKDGGDSAFVYNHVLKQSLARRGQLLKKAAGAFKKGEFYLNHQIIIDAYTKMPAGMESLLRWQTCRGEQISPFEFIPILEDTRLICTVGLWVVRQACLDYLELTQSGLLCENAWVSVNVSPIQLQDMRFSHGVEQILNSMDMPAHCLHLELTETLMVERKDILIRELLKIKALGCHLSIDDFGVGQSSMSSLKDLPFDTLKIDQSFIRPFSNQPNEKAILRAMIALGHNLGKKVVAEGVEKKEAAAFLIEEKCDYLQGYFFSKPAALAEVKTHLEPLGNIIMQCKAV